MPKKKKVVVIGAGVSGIVATKACLEEDFDVITIDKADSWGGVWRFELGREKASHSGQVWQNLVTTSSAFVTSFSDFMPPEKSTGESHSEWAPFHMSHMTYRKFLADYINKFGISKCFRLHTTVKAVQDRKNGDAHAGYSVHVSSTQDGKCVEDTLECDFVIVASGQHQSTKLPAIPGLQEFKASGGLVLHSTEYVDAKPFAGKRVLVIGAGDSGADLVKHISDVSAPGKTYISLRNGVHVLPRMGVESLRKGAAWTASDEAVPADYNIMRAQMYRPLHMRTKNLEMLPGTLKALAMETKDPVVAELYRLHYMLNGKTEDTYFATKSHEMCKALGSGAAQLRPGVKRFEGPLVVFEPAHSLPNDVTVCAPIADAAAPVDAVVLCTGFKQAWPFLPRHQMHDHLERYHLVFHPELPNMAFVGFARPSGLGAIPPLAEMQARWVAQVIAGRALLPSRNEALKLIASHKADFTRVRPDAEGHTFVQFVLYLETLARKIDAAPHMGRLFFTDRKLWSRLMFGPFNSMQYRLVGPHANPAYVKQKLFEGRVGSYLRDRLPKPVLMLTAAKGFVLGLLPGKFGRRHAPLLEKQKIIAA